MIELIKEGIELLSKVPPSVVPHVVEFLRGLVAGDKARAERAATLAATEQLFERPRKPKKTPGQSGTPGATGAGGQHGPA